MEGTEAWPQVPPSSDAPNSKSFLPALTGPRALTSTSTAGSLPAWSRRQALPAQPFCLKDISPSPSCLTAVFPAHSSLKPSLPLIPLCLLLLCCSPYHQSCRTAEESGCLKVCFLLSFSFDHLQFEASTHTNHIWMLPWPTLKKRTRQENCGGKQQTKMDQKYRRKPQGHKKTEKGKRKGKKGKTESTHSRRMLK